MKKIILIITLLIGSTLASSIDAERKIYKTIIRTIFPDKKTVYVWTDSLNKSEVISGIKFVKMTKNKKDADFLIINKLGSNMPQGKKVFADGYLVFKTHKKQLIGGFYWQKGRPNLVFIKNNLQKYNINLPKDFKSYIE